MIKIRNLIKNLQQTFPNLIQTIKHISVKKKKKIIIEITIIKILISLPQHFRMIHNRPENEGAGKRS